MFSNLRLMCVRGVLTLYVRIAECLENGRVRFAGDRECVGCRQTRPS